MERNKRKWKCWRMSCCACDRVVNLLLLTGASFRGHPCVACSLHSGYKMLPLSSIYIDFSIKSNNLLDVKSIQNFGVILEIERENLGNWGMRAGHCAPGATTPGVLFWMRWSNLRQQQQRSNNLYKGSQTFETLVSFTISQPWGLFPEFYFCFYIAKSVGPGRQIYAPKSVRSAMP